jgi:hypothetical protein
MIHLQGTMIIPGPPGPGTSFLLPVGYRPAAIREFAVPYGQFNECGGTGCDEGLTVLQVRPGGVVQPIGRPGIGQNFAEGVSLDGVEFRAK